MSHNVAPIIPKVYLQGHQAPVLCLDHSSTLINEGCGDSSTASESLPISGSLLSGSEDGTARLWDLRAINNHRASICMVIGTDVLSVAFAPPFPSIATTSISPFSRNHCVYLSSGCHIYAYDLRKVQNPVVREPHMNLSTIFGSTDEVNQLCLSQGRKPPIFLAAGDDAGTVRVVDTGIISSQRSHPQAIDAQQTRYGYTRILYHDATGVAIVTSTSFRPRSKGWELASGGTDCCVHIWDVNKPKRPSCSYRIIPDPPNSETSTSSASTNQVCNPPMVHSLAWSPSGRLLAVGLGDSTCRVLRVEGRTCVEVARLEDGHGAPVASVVFPEWFGASTLPTAPSACSRHVAARDRLLTSAGNDGVILGWDLGSVAAGDGAHDPALFLQECTLQTVGKAAQPMDLSDDLQGLSMQEDELFRPSILFRITHRHKPNWMTTSRGIDTVFPSTLFVADTTNDITAYTIPLR